MAATAAVAATSDLTIPAATSGPEVRQAERRAAPRPPVATAATWTTTFRFRRVNITWYLLCRFFGDPGRTNNQTYINGLGWFTNLKRQVVRKRYFPAVAHRAGSVLPLLGPPSSGQGRVATLVLTSGRCQGARHRVLALAVNGSWRTLAEVVLRTGLRAPGTGHGGA